MRLYLLAEDFARNDVKGIAMTRGSSSQNTAIRYWSRLSRSRAWLLVALALIIAFIGALLLWALPAWLTLHPRVAGAERHKAISDARTGIAAFLAVLATGGGLAYTARTYRLSRRGQIADRYTKAIEQLSNMSSDIRIGGIFALEQTTRDGAEYGDTVIEVLAAYIRIHTQWHAAVQRRNAWTLSRRRATSENPPGPDIHIALSVLRKLVRITDKRDLDLSGSNLAGADLMEMQLLDARLNDVNLAEAKLNNADLRGADLRGAELANAQFYRTDLTDAVLTRGQVSQEALGRANGVDAIQWMDP